MYSASVIVLSSPRSDASRIAGLIRDERRLLRAAPAGEHQCAVGQGDAAGGGGEGVGLVDQGLRGGELARGHMAGAVHLQREREHRQGARVARQLDVAGRQHVPALVLPQADRHQARVQQTLHLVLARERLVAERGQRAPQDRHRGRSAVRDQERLSRHQQLGGARRLAPGQIAQRLACTLERVALAGRQAPLPSACR